jgi:hypothetical protein
MPRKEKAGGIQKWKGEASRTVEHASFRKISDDMDDRRID